MSRADTRPRARRTGFYRGVGAPIAPRLRPFALPHPKDLKPLLASWVVLARLVLLRGVCGGLLFFHYLQAFDLLEGEAHYAAVLALVLKVDRLLVVVDHDLRRNPAAVVEPLCPLRDVFVLYPLGLLAHPRLLLSLLVFLYPEEAPYIPQEGAKRRLRNGRLV